MARSHSHSKKIGEARKARRRKRQRVTTPPLVLQHPIVLAWICNDASCVMAHGPQ